MITAAIFFDLDDTLWDFRGSSEMSLDMVFLRYLFQHGVDKQEWLGCYALANGELWGAYQKGTHTALEVKELRFARSFECVGVCLPQSSISEVSQYYLSEIVQNTRLYPDVKAVLETLHKTYTLGIISNGMAVSRERLDSHGIGQYFAHIITAADAGAPKPAPEIFAYALAAADVAPQEAVYVGDDYRCDVLGSKRAGMLSVWYNQFGKDGDGVAPDHVISSFEELAQIFVNPLATSEA